MTAEKKAAFFDALRCCVMPELVQEDAIFKAIMTTAASYGITASQLSEAIQLNASSCQRYLEGEAVPEPFGRQAIVEALFEIHLRSQ